MGEPGNGHSGYRNLEFSIPRSVRTTASATRSITLKFEAATIRRQLRESCMASRASLASLTSKARQCRDWFWSKCDSCSHQQQCKKRGAAEGVEHSRIAASARACVDMTMSCLNPDGFGARASHNAPPIPRDWNVEIGLRFLSMRQVGKFKKKPPTCGAFTTSAM